MRSLLRLVFHGHFLIQFAFAAALGWGAFTLYQSDATALAARQALLASDPPAVVDVAEAAGAAREGVPVEVRVRAAVATDLNTRLVRRTSGVKTGESLLFVLTDPDATDETMVARAAMVIDPGDLDAVANYLVAAAVPGALVAKWPVAEIGGVKSQPSGSSHVSKVLTERGVTQAPGFFFIEPFHKGRAETLARTSRDASTFHWLVAAFAGLVGLVGLKNMLRRRAAVAPVFAPALASAEASPVAAGPVAAGPVVARARLRPIWLRLVQFAVVIVLCGGLLLIKLPNLVFSETGQMFALPSMAELSAMAAGAGEVASFLAPAVLSLGVMVLVAWLWLRKLRGALFPAQEARKVVPMAKSLTPAEALAAEAAPGGGKVLPAWAMVKHEQGVSAEKAAEAERARLEADVAVLAARAAEKVAAQAQRSAQHPAQMSGVDRDTRRAGGWRNDGPVRPGFSLRTLLPSRKPVAMPANDPFERLAAQVRAERARDEERLAAVRAMQGRAYPAE